MTAVRLSAGASAAVVHPAYGCLISSFEVEGVELLYSRGGVPSSLPPLGPPGRASERDFDDGIFRGGWFPMFPVAGMPDESTWQHGWAPRVAWEVGARRSDSLRSSAGGDFLDGGGARVVREIRLSRGALTVFTAITNSGDGMRTYTFGEHPCFPRELFAGGAIVSPEPLPLAARADGFTGHAQWATGSLAVSGPPGGPTVTVAAEGLPFGVLWSSFAADDLPDVDCFAWEPCTSRGLGIVDARTSDSLTRIAPGETHRYRVRVEGRIADVSEKVVEEER